MARSVRLFLIRHGETVDNVASLYAGIRDSELTNHGYQQATRLGVHFMTTGLSFTHIFSSHLQRAAKTAGKIREAQLALSSKGIVATAVPEVKKVPLLVEQDFGSMEGKKWSERQSEPKPQHRLEKKGPATFVDLESKDSMAQRADTFLHLHILPLLDDTSRPAEKCIAIVSHGIFLSTLWKRLLLCLPKKSVALSSDLRDISRPPLEHLGGWSNTGYLELLMIQPEAPHKPAILPSSVSACSPPPAQMPAPDEGLVSDEALEVTHGSEPAQREALNVFGTTTESTASSTSRVAHGWTTTILSINGKDHLKGFKRTGGGVGSSRHDSSQKSLETFFKKRRIE
ncbi:histidine phosphatase superfamily [Phaeosphaeriaceae sp. PMI808]|nr:histidine phosphatase superfamily [Phaeosphaeriaceae sp. PMI808]